MTNSQKFFFISFKFLFLFNKFLTHKKSTIINNERESIGEKKRDERTKAKEWTEKSLFPVYSARILFLSLSEIPTDAWGLLIITAYRKITQLLKLFVMIMWIFSTFQGFKKPYLVCFENYSIQHYTASPVSDQFHHISLYCGH